MATEDSCPPTTADAEDALEPAADGPPHPRAVAFPEAASEAGLVPLLTYPPAAPGPAPRPHVRPPRPPKGAPVPFVPAAGCPTTVVVQPTVPVVRYTDVDYPHTNDTYFNISHELPPVPLDPPRPRPPPPAPDPEWQRNPPPAYRYAQPGAPGAVSRTFVHRPGPERDDVTPLELGLDESDQGGSVGTGIQMLAQGPQNYMLDIHAHMSFFRPAVYRRHTAFAMECFEDEVTLAFGRPVTVELVRRADMLGDVFLEVALPDLGIPGGRWVDAVGYVLLSRVRLVMGDVVLHDQERLWYDLVDRVFMPHGKRRAVDAMIGRGRVLATDAAHTVHVPFKFLCCKNHYANQQFLPLASLSPNVKLTVEITTEGLEGLVHLPAGAAPPPTLTTLAAKVLSEQAFVDPDEKRAAMHHPARLMIESFQDVDALSYTFDDAGTYDLKSVSLDLRELNLPVKTVLLVAYDDNATQSKRYFDYLDCVDRAVLLIASAERFPPRAGEYFSLVQTYQHSSACAPDNVHMYSFALDASQRQPSGTLNFAPLANPTLRVDLKNTGGRAVKVKAFAQCLNWLTVQSGSMDYLFNA